MTQSTSIDDLFRQKSLHDIHDHLRQTRIEVESKKQELRELVGDHYRSVLESSDHIRAMSDCAAKVSAGADRIEELIASMRTLAASPPASAGNALPKSDPDEVDEGYHMGSCVMALLEVPELVRGHLSEHRFVQAARAALIDAVRLQGEIDELLGPGGSAATKGQPAKFDYAALVRQQAAVFRNIPRQITSSCVDAFGAVTLAPASAAESFVMHLLLDATSQPVPLLEKFLGRRQELVRSLLDVSFGSSDANFDMEKGCGARLAAAAMAFEGTVVLSSGFCHGSAGDRSLLDGALAAVLEGCPDCSAAEERAAIEGRQPAGTGMGALRRRVENLGTSLRQLSSGTSPFAVRLSALGGQLAQEWVPEGPAGGGPRSLPALFGRLVAAALSEGGLQTCARFGAMLGLCTESVTAYRQILTKGSAEGWATVWKLACGRFCPGRGPPPDALSIVTASVESACAELVCAHVRDLALELVPGDDEGSALGAHPEAGAGRQSEAAYREKIAEMQQQSRLRVLDFDEHLGHIIGDVEHVARDGKAPVAVTAALLNALHDRLSAACDKVYIPSVTPVWPQDQDGGEKPQSGGSAAMPQKSWQVQQVAARAAIALDALLAVAMDDGKDADAAAPSQLNRLLSSASLLGDSSLIAQAKAIFDKLRQHSNAAYCVWARLAVIPDETSTRLEGLWRLTDEEVRPTCGWGSVTFTKAAAAGRGGAVGGGAAGEGGAAGDVAKPVPVPVQASPFVFERLILGAQRAFEVSSNAGSMPSTLVMALKVALSEAFVATYAAEPPNLEKLKRSGMSHLLQWLFDLNFLRIALSASAAVGAAAGGSGYCAAYDALLGLRDRAEAAALSDPVDRLLYGDCLKASVKSHVQGVRILLSPFFQHNPLYGFLFKDAPSLAAGKGAPGDGDCFELQAGFALPLRPALPRFTMLPVAMSAMLARGGDDLDARFAYDPAGRGAARDAASAGGVGAGVAAVNSLMHNLGLGKGTISANWMSSWSGGAGGAGAPTAV